MVGERCVPCRQRHRSRCRLQDRFAFVERIVADGGYAGAKMRTLVARTGARNLQIVKRIDVGRFVVLPKRWIVERTLGRVSRNRRLAATTSTTP